jgi:hypothetical protein
MPQGLLEPLVPIANPNKATVNNPVAETPRVLRANLDETARARVADVQHFQSLWRDPELKSVWDHVESRINESNGQMMQPTGKWERDYDVLLKELSQEENSKIEQRQREDEEAERATAQSADGEWQKVLERFTERGVPGVRVNAENGADSLAVALVRVGVVFLLKGIPGPGTPVSEWEVSIQTGSRALTKMEISILDCVGSRPRKWDLTFLLVCLAIDSEKKKHADMRLGHGFFLCRYQANAVCEVHPANQ